MKKLLTLLAVVMAAFCFASCDKDSVEEVHLQSKLAVNIDVAGINGPDTKAVKTGWTAGDKLNIWFDGAYWNKLPQLVLTYDGSEWIPSEMDESILKESGTFNVIYEASNSEFTVARINANYNFPSYLMLPAPSGAMAFSNVPMSCYQNQVPYTYAEGTICASISDWQFLTMLQVVITGLDKPAIDYALKIEGVEYTYGYTFDETSGVVSRRSYFHPLAFTIGVPNEDGVAFYFGANTNPESRDIVFTLRENRFSQAEFTFTKTSTELITDPTCVKAIKIDRSKFLPVIPLAEAVDLGLSVKWASFNIGASAPEESGWYLAWGETETKRNYDWSRNTEYKWGTYNDEDAFKGMYKYKGDAEGGDGLKTLLPVDDAASVNWGREWRTPTTGEISELLDNTKCRWTWDSEKKGYTVTSLINGESIFLPARGYMVGENVVYPDYGFYWSSSLYKAAEGSWAHQANSLYFRSGGKYTGNIFRATGVTVRAVTE